jgi:hypothetical protein
MATLSGRSGTLFTWSVPVIFGMVGGGIDPLIEAINVREDKVPYVAGRDDISAARATPATLTEKVRWSAA